MTVREYESRAERYDKQLRELVGVEPDGLSTEEKVAAAPVSRGPVRATNGRGLPAARLGREWRSNAGEIRELGIDFPGRLALIEQYTG